MYLILGTPEQIICERCGELCRHYRTIYRDNKVYTEWMCLKCDVIKY